MNIQFTVVSSNPNSKGGFVWKLTCAEVVKAFGVEKSIKRTYYIGGMPTAATVGQVLTENMNMFDVEEHEFRNPETGDMMQLKWLKIKCSLDRKA